MYLLENPVLQRELLVNLRMRRAFVLLFAYVALLGAVVSFGMVSLACSSYFQRAAASLVVSYLAILPLALSAVLFWGAFPDEYAKFRLAVTVTIFPLGCAAIGGVLFVLTCRRLLHPP